MRYFILIILMLSLVYAKDYKFPFQNPDLKMEDRIDDLVGRLTLEEKIGQIIYNADAIPRLDIPQYNWWSECLHGVARNGRATVFPQAIGLAATFDPELIHRVGSAIGREGRAKFNLTSAKGYRDIYQGLTFWSPNVNIFRDPRWGRGHETYGEDPYLTSEIGKAFVKGLQGNDPNYLQAAGCAKHYVVHSGPEGLRHEFNAVVSQKDLWETYMPAFEALVTEAKVEGVMGAYNRTNDYPCCAHPYLMSEVLFKDWEFDGYFTSDCWAIHDFYRGHNVVETVEEAAAMAVKYGCHLNCGDAYPSLLDAVNMGLVSETDIDKILKQLLKTRFRLGLFDPAEKVPFSNISADVIRCDEHVALTREAAVKSIVLLKNENNLLPFRKDAKKVYVTGPLATHVQGLLANYYGLSENLVTIVEGVTQKVDPATKVMYRQGALLDRPNLNPMDWFSGEAEDADLTIACLGISQLIEGEEGEAIASPYRGDRKDIQLPQNQVKFLKTIRKKAENLVVVMIGGSPIACEEVYEIADAMLFAWYPGEQGGNAVADVVFGDAVPSGRLPITFPKSIEDLPPYEDYSMTGRTYKYMEKEPLFPLGFGLSYTDFEYSGLRLNNKKIKSGDPVIAELTLKNTGKYDAEEVIQLYISDLKASVRVPNFDMKQITRVHLKSGESKKLKIKITPEMMKIVNNDGEKMLEPGKFKLYVGGSSPLDCSRKLGAAEMLTAIFEMK
ncbi:MAG: glycoside hydrolase family 3 C-terminal domain-containing protein [Fidelibacterota bacterium]